MTELLFWGVGLLVGIPVGALMYKRSVRLPYRFVCHQDGCHFTSAANNLSMLDRIATQHERLHT